MTTDQLPAEVVNRIESELLPGEELLWVGRPGRVGLGNIAVNGAVMAVAAVFILGVLGALFMAPVGVSVSTGSTMVESVVEMVEPVTELVPPIMELGAPGMGTTQEIVMATSFSPLSTIMMLIPLLLILLLVAAIAIPLIRRSQSLYAVTDRRALIMQGRRTRSFGANDIQFIERRMTRGGTGDVIFASQIKDRYAGNTGRRITTEPVGFLGIEHPQEVEALMLDVFRGMGSKVKNDALYGKPKNDDLDLYDVEIGPDGEIQERKR